jgi:hypothetical protein
VRKRDVNRMPRLMYRDERLGVHLNVKVTREMRQALGAGAVGEGMRDADFARRIIDLGLGAWRTRPMVERRRMWDQRLGQRVMYRALGGGVNLDLQMSPEMRKALSTGAAAEGVRVSEFARKVMDLGLMAWQAERAPKTRCPGGG